MFILYNLMVFLTGFLILSIQLIFGKSILPIFGGAPNVWLTSLAFYQVVLTLGYLYSYVMQKKIKLKNQIIIHSSLFILSLFFIPIGLNRDFLNISDSASLSLFITTLLSIGIPYFLLTASSPLIQSWFGNSKLEKSNNPYVLYVSSNLGTFLSLISYPFLIEIYLSTQDQFSLWSILFLLEIILIITCGVFLYKISNKEKNEAVETNKHVKNIDYKTILIWILVAFVPSALLSVITNKITIDIAPIPLLWIMPLGLYFLSFSIAFSDRFKSFNFFNYAGLLLLIIVFFISATSSKDIYLILFYLMALFFISVTFHNFLYKNAPQKEHLTLFYLLMSVGGACGGIFIGIISPLIFSSYYEFYIVLFLGSILCLQFSKKENIKYNLKQNILCFLPFTLLFCFGIFKDSGKENIIYQERTFFGVNKVSQSTFIKDKIEYKINLLTHGTTLHGGQIKSPSNLSSTTLTYYSFNNPLYLGIKDYDDFYSFKNIGIIGLGTGSMNCMFENKNVSFFEIDQEMINIAQSKFTYLEICNNQQEFLLGDARMKMKEIEDNKFDIIVIDAFSSDAIPIHLITKEAVSMYIEKSNHNSLLSFHISNRYLNLEAVLGNIAKELNLQSKICYIDKNENDILSTSSKVVIMSKSLDFVKNGCWKVTKTDNNNTWNDNYSNIFDYLIL